MKRRSFLGALAGAPLVGKAAAAEAAGTSTVGLASGINDAGQNYAYADAITGESPRQELAGLTARLLGPGEHFKVTGEMIRRVARLDPDLASSRAFSLSAKVRMQAQRDARRCLEMERDWMQERIDGLRKRVLGL